MRLNIKNNTIIISILVEICIFALVGLVFLFQYTKAKEDFVTKTRAIAETIGDLSGSFFTEENTNPSSDEFYHFLDERLGKKKLFNTFELAPKFFSVRFGKDLNLPNENEGVFMRDVDPKEEYKVENKAGVISVSVPFTLKDMLEPYGVIKIDSDKSAIAKKVLSDNFLLYAAMLVVFNNQAFIVFLLLRRKKEVVFEKGYLRENSLGALKIMHKLIGDMIVDNESEPDKAETESSENNKNLNKKNVISISSLYDKKLK